MGEVIYGRFHPTGRMGPAHRTHPANQLIRQCRQFGVAKHFEISKTPDGVKFVSGNNTHDYGVSFEAYAFSWLKSLKENKCLVAYNFTFGRDKFSGEALLPVEYDTLPFSTHSFELNLSFESIRDTLIEARVKGNRLYGNKFLGIGLLSDSQLHLFYIK